MQVMSQDGKVDKLNVRIFYLSCKFENKGFFA